MLSINTNIASLITQNSMKTSTDKLNQAIERMTTGCKINHASDNAANYSISTNLTTQLSAYDVAADNVAMGMDLVSYASDIISQMQDKAARLNALSTQARNGTYGAQSLSALNSEASAIMSEIMRLYSTAEYNDISLFNRTAYTIAPHLPQAGESGFIDETALISMAAAGEGAGIAEGEVVGTTTEAPKAKAEYNGFIEDPTAGKDQAHIESLTSVTEANGTLTGTEYKVSSVNDLVELARLVNVEGVDTTGKTFYLTADLDLGAYCEANMATGGWTPIGDYSTNTNYKFKGTFDGNGHVIKNLKIDRETANYQGLFGRVENGELKNVGLENVDIKGQGCVGGLVSYSTSSISNSYATGNVSGNRNVGGLVGSSGSSSSSSISNSYATVDVSMTGSVGAITNCFGGLVGISYFSISNSYATGNVTGHESVGGLVGSSKSTISNSYATGDVTGGNSSSYGGLVGSLNSTISNSYATGNVSGNRYVGGLVGNAQTSSVISNSYATGTVSGTDRVGGLVGSSSSISNSYATGNVTGQSSSVGGLIGQMTGAVTNCYATGNVTGYSTHVGGLVGTGYSSSNTASITNCYATGDVVGSGMYVGGLAGYSPFIIENSYASGTVIGQDSYTGGLVGYSYSSSSISNSYATGTVSGTSSVGGLVGYSYSSSSISNSYATGAVTGTSNVGGLVGYSFSSSSISNSYATGNVTGQSSNVGGLVGSSSSISNSYATGNVTGQGSYVGGLVGQSYSSISNSYATGNVTGQSGSVGGLAGYATSSISNSYATGMVSGDNEVGGLVGFSSSSISNSYATGNVSGTSRVGGLVGHASSSISNSYATGAVSGTSSVGGLVGYARCYVSNVEITDSTSYCSVNGDTAIGSLVGNVCCTEITDSKSDRGESINERTGELLLNNCSAIDENDYIGGYYKRNVISHRYTDPDTGQGVSRYEEHEEIDTTFDVSIYNANITAVPLSPVATTLQVGIYNNSSCQINFVTNFEFDLSGFGDIQSVETFDAIVAFENLLSEKATQLGAVQNRLDSALESIEVNINNLTSSRSTIRDADIAEVSSEYIKQQILQQASATLMATANQAPAIALQLI